MYHHGIRIFSMTLNLLGTPQKKRRRNEIDLRWGSMSYLELTEEDITVAQNEIDTPQAKLGQWVLTLLNKLSLFSVLQRLLGMMLLGAVNLSLGLTNSSFLLFWCDPSSIRDIFYNLSLHLRITIKRFPTNSPRKCVCCTI